LTVRRLDPESYSALKELAAGAGRSMEAEARDILREGVLRRARWEGAKLSALSGGPELADIETPYVRSMDLPSEPAL
jgi:plasmid stability protein